MQNRDDLLNLNNNKKNFKKPLIYGAIAFLVFIIAILGFAIYNNSSSKQDNVVIPPQIKETKQETMFKEVPIEDNKQSLTEKLVKEEKPVEKPQVEEKKETNIKPQVEEKKETNIKPQIEEKKEVKQVSVKTAQEKEKPQVQKEVKPVQDTVKKGQYYIQVAALMKYKKPNKKFLKLIEKEGYKYRLYETSYVKNGKRIEVIKILIGPFDKNSVRKELQNVKRKITQNAFVFKVK